MKKESGQRSDGLADGTPYIVSNLTTVARLGCASIDLDSLFSTLSLGEAMSSDSSLSLRVHSVKKGLEYGRARVRNVSCKDEYIQENERKLRRSGAGGAAKGGQKGADDGSKSEDHEDEDDVIDKKKQCPPRCVRKSFANQVTLSGEITYEDTEGRSFTKVISAKVFQNGALQITGARMMSHAASIPDAISKILPIPFGPDEQTSSGQSEQARVVASSARVCMINAQSHLGYTVDRRRLHDYICNHHKEITTYYEPCVHAAVKVYFMHNRNPASTPDGACSCSFSGSSAQIREGKDIQKIPCKGKGDGDGVGQCRRVTLLIFRSGHVTMTGARSIQQLDDVHAFIVRISALAHHDL